VQVAADPMRVAVREQQQVAAASLEHSASPSSCTRQRPSVTT
jgi:hypothetical protein